MTDSANETTQHFSKCLHFDSNVSATAISMQSADTLPFIVYSTVQCRPLS